MAKTAYQRILHKYAGQKMRLTQSGARDIEKLLRTAAADATREIDTLGLRYGQDNVRIEQLRGLRDRMEQAIDGFTNSYRGTVDVTRDALGTTAIHRIRDLTHEASGVIPASDILLKAKLGAFETLAKRTRFEDGLLLSQRIWRVGDDAKRKMGAILSRDVLAGYHPTKIARDLRGFVSAKGRGNLRYVTERLARTEHTAAFAQVSKDTIRAINRDKEIPVTFAMRWNLSPGHKEIDQCDDAAQGGDIAPGVYSAGSFPTIPLHPNDQCFDTPVPIVNGKPIY